MSLLYTLYFNHIEVSECIDINKANGSYEGKNCYYSHFLRIYFSFQPNKGNDCHNLLKKGLILNEIAIAYIKGNTNRIHFLGIRKDEAINLMKKVVLHEIGSHYE